MLEKANLIYADNNATSKPSKRAMATMLDVYNKFFGNPSSGHADGLRAKYLLDDARKSVANLLAVKPSNIIFTASGTEANNIAIRDIMCLSGKRIVISSIEHASVYNTALCFNNSIIPVDERGYIDEDAYAQTLLGLGEEVKMISIILAHNEFGTIQDIRKLSLIARQILGETVVIHTDATQALCKYGNINPENLGVNILTGSAHKFHGPRGVGLIVKDDKTKLCHDFCITGGGQESGVRSGTENLAAICGAKIAMSEMLSQGIHARIVRVKKVRDYLLKRLLSELPWVTINGDPERGLYNTLNFSFKGYNGVSLMRALDKSRISVGTASACGTNKPSRPLSSLTSDKDIIDGALRVSFSEENTLRDVDAIMTCLKNNIL